MTNKDKARLERALKQGFYYRQDFIPPQYGGPIFYSAPKKEGTVLIVWANGNFVAEFDEIGLTQDRMAGYGRTWAITKEELEHKYD